MSDTDRDTPQLDVESGFSDEEKSEIRAYIDDVATRNRISPDDAKFDRHSARSGVLIPSIVNGAAVVGIIVGILVLRLLFNHDQETVQSSAIEYASIEGRLIRELRNESQQQILAKQQEIESVKAQLQKLEDEQTALENDMQDKIAAREAELREELQKELDAERARLVANGTTNADIERLMKAYETQRQAYYDQQLATYKAQLEDERTTLQNQIDALRTEYQQRLSALQDERQKIVDDFKQREDDLRVQLEQRTRVLEVARVEATADLESAQRQLSDLQRASDNVQAVENQIDGQIEQIEAALQDNTDELALQRIDTLTTYLGTDQIAQIQTIARRRQSDLFLLRQLRSLVETRVQTATSDTRSVTEELRLLGRIRQLGEQAGAAPTSEDARKDFELLLQTLPEVAQAHEAIVDQVRDEAVADEREAQRTIVDEGNTTAASYVAAGDYGDALKAYVTALGELPAVAPDADQIVGNVLRLGYAMTDYVVKGQSSAGLADIAQKANVNMQADRAALQARIDAAVNAAVSARDAELRLQIANRDDRINSLQTRATTLEAQIASLQGNADALADMTLVPTTDYNKMQADLASLDTKNSDLTAQLASLTDERNRIDQQRQALQIQRDQLIDERAKLRTRYTEYAQAQKDAVSSGDYVALANARDAFFLSPELDLFMPGLSDLIDQYDQQYAAEQQTTDLSAFQVNEILQELSGNLTTEQRKLLLQDALQGANEDGDTTFAQFLTLLSQVVTESDGSAQ